MDATNQENQPPKKKEKKSKKRISFIGRQMPLPAYRKISIDKLYDLIDERSKLIYTHILDNLDTLKEPLNDFVKGNIKHFKELSQSLDEYDYDPEAFDYIKIKEFPSKLQIVDGVKRILILKRKNKNKNIEILHLEDLVIKRPNSDIKRKNLKKLLSGFKDTNTKASE